MASIINASTDNGVLTITVAGQPTITVNPSDLTTAIRDAALLHGLKQKIVDAAALSRNETTGASATPSDKYHAMMDVVHQLSMGDWNKRAAGDGSASRGLLVEALIRVTGNDPETVSATVKGWDDATQAAMRASAAVAPVIATIKAERAARKPAPAASGVDAGALLAGLMGSPAQTDTRAEVNQALQGAVAKATKGKKVAQPA